MILQKMILLQHNPYIDHVDPISGGNGALWLVILFLIALGFWFFIDHQQKKDGSKPAKKITITKKKKV